MPGLEPIAYDDELSQEEIDLYGEFRRLVPILIEGQVFYVPENNSVLRCLQFLELREGVVRMDWGRYCWNDTKGCCDMRYRRGPGAAEHLGRACLVTVEPGLEITELPKGGRWCPDQKK